MVDCISMTISIQGLHFHDHIHTGVKYGGSHFDYHIHTGVKYEGFLECYQCMNHP